MTNRNICRPALCAALATLWVGCAQVPEQENAEMVRLDEVVVKLDQSLANQAAVAERLDEQQRQLDVQQEQLMLLSDDVGRALQEPPPNDCPEVTECPELKPDFGKVVVGAQEEIWLSDLEIPVTARMDTGAQTAFLNTSSFETFERNGEPWVRFEIVDTRSNEPVTVERKLRRTVTMAGSDPDKPTRRPVVKLGVVIGEIDQTAEFILRVRKSKSYQALIGRSILSDVMLVDVSKENIAPYVLPERPSGEAGVAR